MPKFSSVKNALSGQISVGQQVSVRGWLRSKRGFQGGNFLSRSA